MAGLALTVPRIAAALAGREPVLCPGANERAAVALLLHDPGDGEPRLLLMERARREGDPWSGDLAFPGGRMEAGDADERAAAERETAEEIGVDLAGAGFLGPLDDMSASLMPMTVSAFVYSLAESAPAPVLSLSEEVREVFWIPLSHLFDRRRLREHRLRRGAAEHRFPALDLLGPGRPLLWGLSYRFTRSLGALVGEDLPGAAGGSRP